MKIGRNAPCPCGSGQKYKRCHGSIAAGPSPARVQHMFDRINSEHRIQERQQGLGRPIIGIKMAGKQLVAVGNRLFHSDKWKTFGDFLADYIKTVLGGDDWGNVELAKPVAHRHPLLQWYDELCRYQQETIKQPGNVTTAAVCGVVACYFGVAYSLYLLAHNAELQDRLVRRLKDPGQFQGAYYELLVANALIRAGFELTLEDETDGERKHCEFAAISKKTGKRYWVEAKMRGVVGLLGRTNADGGPNDKPLSKLVQHLNRALAKPAEDERLIFIDLNAEMAPDISDDKRPDFLEKAIQRLEQFERDGDNKGQSAYVYITNIAFHRSLRGFPALLVAPYGLGIADFNKPGMYRLSERYMLDQKHGDAVRIAAGFSGLTQFPSTFDGNLPSEVFENSERVLIGETYDFGSNIGVAIVTTATVAEEKKTIFFGVTSLVDGTGSIIEKPMTDAEFTDYKEHSDAYFGRLQPAQRVAKTPYEFFESLVEIHKRWGRDQILAHLKGAPDFAEFEALPHDRLVPEYCERVVAIIEASKPK